jgi:nitrite reductase (NADH) large subunit
MDYLIIGNGVAGTTAAENIRKNDQDAKITIVTEEDSPFYYRIRLNEYIAGDLTEASLHAKKDPWYEEMGIDLRLRTRITGVDAMNHVVVTEDGQSLTYDKLLMASGSSSFIPPIKGSDKKGVFSIRSLQDARAIIAHAKAIRDVVIIGGGLLGLEAGNAFLQLNMSVTVIEFFPRLLPRQLDGRGAERLKAAMEVMGFRFRLGTRIEEIEGDEKVTSVRLEGGERIPAGMVIISAGVRPNLELPRAMGLECDKGIKINDHLGTNLPDVYAAGDVAEFKGTAYGIWPAAMEQGKIAGINMAGGNMVYNGTIMANTLKVVGIDLASAGDIDSDNKHESRTFINEKTYKKIVLDNSHMIGCIMIGDTSGFNKITKAITEKKDVSAIKDMLLSEGFDFNSI